MALTRDTNPDQQNVTPHSETHSPASSHLRADATESKMLDTNPVMPPATGTLDEALLGDQAGIPEHTIEIIGDQKTEAFFSDLCKSAPLPKKINWGHAPAAAFATVTSAAASYLYALGGKKLGLEYVIGGVTINIPQNMLYGFGTADFIKNSYHNFKQVWGRCLTAIGLGVTATLPSAIASWRLSGGSYISTGLTFIGNAPNNIYGMYDAIKRPLDYKDDNPKLRKFLLDEFRNSLPEEYRNILMDERATATIVAGNLLGLGLGTALVGAQTGYVCSASRFLGEIFGEKAGIALGILTDSPTLLIAFLMSGFDLAKDGVNLTADVYRHFSGEKKIPITSGDKKYIAALATLIAAFSYFAYRSSGTSQTLYDNDCPDFGEIPSNILRHDIQEGCEFFNEVLMGKFLVQSLCYLKNAYATNEESKNIYRIRAIEQFLLTASRADLEKIAMKHHADKADQWQMTPPAPAAAKSSLCGSVASFFSCKKKPPAAETKTAETAAEVNANSKPAASSSYCGSFMSMFGYGKKAPVADAQDVKKDHTEVQPSSPTRGLSFASAQSTAV
jgi:hypothetical protein